MACCLAVEARHRRIEPKRLVQEQPKSRHAVGDIIVAPFQCGPCFGRQFLLQLRLGGELKTVSILMSDLRGFSALSERLGPETMIGLLNRYFARMVPVILEHRGTINEFIGDAILVLFGAPVERPDDAERAVRCAWAMQRTMAAFNAESRALGLPELTMGIGLHAGRVVAGNIGSSDRVKYGVVGPAVNLASRVQSLAHGGQVLLTGAALARVRGSVRVGPAVRTRVKGVSEPVLSRYTPPQIAQLFSRYELDVVDDAGDPEWSQRYLGIHQPWSLERLVTAVRM